MKHRYGSNGAVISSGGVADYYPTQRETKQQASSSSESPPPPPPPPPSPSSSSPLSSSTSSSSPPSTVNDVEESGNSSNNSSNMDGGMTMIMMRSNNNNHVKNNIDAQLAETLNQMSFQEREVLYEEIHGVSVAIEESEELVSDRLAAMDQELLSIRVKPAYDQAEKIAKEYVTSRKFRLMFLRAQRFHSKKAAEHLVQYMEGKLELFGEATLGRMVQLSDLNAQDLSCLRSGAYQILSQRDRSGRIIFGNFEALLPKHQQIAWPSRSLIRVCTYVTMAAVETDEETQKKGFVGIHYSIGGQPVQYDDEFLELNRRAMHWCPWRIEAIHLCHNEKAMFQKFLSLLVPHLSMYFQIRSRFHFGSHTECRYNLMTFGIPVENVLPVAYDGTLKLNNHVKWISRQEVRDNQLQKLGHFHGIDLPGINDVLAGKGKIVQTHLGNVQMRSLVCSLMEEYEKPTNTRDDRYELCLKIVREIKGRKGGRFLKQESDGIWWELTDAEAVQRVSKSFRNNLGKVEIQRSSSSSSSKALTTYAKSSSLSTGNGVKRARIEKSCCFNNYRG